MTKILLFHDLLLVTLVTHECFRAGTSQPQKMTAANHQADQMKCFNFMANYKKRTFPSHSPRWIAAIAHLLLCHILQDCNLSLVKEGEEKTAISILSHKWHVLVGDLFA